jgi:Fic family protein
MPTAFMVPHLMNNWLLDYKDREPLINHIALEKIHPFVDGNGRTGRMLMWFQELKLGKTPTLFLAHERQKNYYPLFK